MKKRSLFFLIIIFAFILFCIGYILWNQVHYCNPREKEWYNNISLPRISYPYNETYDGSYTIKIDGDGNVLFKPLNGEEIKGTMTVTPNDTYSSAKIFIEFENGETSDGRCHIYQNRRYLSFEYESKYYSFTDERKFSRKEVEEYRAGLIAFLYEVFETGEYPTQQEIKANSVYRAYTGYYQIDPGCGGPIVYDVCKKATVENVDYENSLITIKIDGETKKLLFNDKIMVAYVNDGQFNELSASDLAPGECLVVTDNYSDDLIRLDRIYYFGNN